MLAFQRDDGGRSLTAFSTQKPREQWGDCVIRSIAIGCHISYAKVFNDLKEIADTYDNGLNSVDQALTEWVYAPYLENLGWKLIESPREEATGLLAITEQGQIREFTRNMDLGTFGKIIHNFGLVNHSYILGVAYNDGLSAEHMTVVRNGIIRDIGELNPAMQIQEVWLSENALMSLKAYLK